MQWNLNSDRPIYLQLVEIIQLQIVSGNYLPGDKLPSVRDLAAMAQVNPNTMQKALSELERMGLLITQRTNGRLVTDDLSVIETHKKELAFSHINSFFTTMYTLGYHKGEIMSFIQESEVI
ncbi:MAG: GntR family transcriptional regulator [Eubacteriales bacterium]